MEVWPEVLLGGDSDGDCQRHSVTRYYYFSARSRTEALGIPTHRDTDRGGRCRARYSSHWHRLKSRGHAFHV
eukprot:1606379-Rhodomonas_salina.3